MAKHNETPKRELNAQLKVAPNNGTVEMCGTFNRKKDDPEPTKLTAQNILDEA